jgi:hypothetical protein
MFSSTKISFVQKMLVCFVTTLVLTYPLNRIHTDYLPHWFPTILLAIFIYFFLFAAIAFLIAWQVLEQKKKINSKQTFAFIQGILIYTLAFFFMKWGLLKILRLHMTTSLGWMEMPMTMLSGEQQLSHFFGQNYPMVVSFALIEMIGAVLILFRKTRMLGIFMLIIITAGIVLIDFLYDVNKGVFIEACILLMGLLYIAFQDRKKIVDFFFNTSDAIRSYKFKNIILKNVIRFSALLLPFLFLYPNYKPAKHKALIGKYAVMKLYINGKNISLDINSDTILSHVYFDLGEYFAFTYNHFNKTKVGKFSFDENTRLLLCSWIKPTPTTDTLFAKLSILSSVNTMMLNGKMGSDSIIMELLKVPVKSVTNIY